MYIMKKAEQGVVLLITLVVLIIMTLGAIAISRSVDSTTLIAGNLAFRQSAQWSGDAGTETAVAWLDGQLETALLQDVPAQGYWAAAITIQPDSNKTWDKFWTESLTDRARRLDTDAVGNTVFYVVDRMCSSVGTTDNCIFLPGVTTSTSGGQGESALLLKGIPQVLYRITARIEGPRNTITYVQTNVAK